MSKERSGPLKTATVQQGGRTAVPIQNQTHFQYSQLQMRFPPLSAGISEKEEKRGCHFKTDTLSYPCVPEHIFLWGIDSGSEADFENDACESWAAAYLQ